MALVGSACGISVALILPPILHSLCHWDYGISKLQIFVNFSMVMIGIFAFVTGTISSIYAIFHDYAYELHGTTRHIRN